MTIRRLPLTLTLNLAIFGFAIGALGLASPSAHAVSLGEDGVGQVLIYPYYTVNNNQNTYLTIVNNSDVGKAANVRFLEGYDGRSLLSFNVFLQPFDTWSGAIFSTGDETSGGAILTRDPSCTVPNLNASPTRLPDNTPYTAFSLAKLNPSDTGPTGATRTREGFIQVIAMGDIAVGSPLDAATRIPLGGQPTCDGLDNSAFIVSDLLPPTTGLDGQLGIIDVEQGTYFTVNATAIDGFTATTLYSDPTTNGDHPNLADANTSGGVAAADLLINGQHVTASYNTTNNGGIDAVSAVLATDQIYNEYINAPSLGASTDWLLTFPTKQFYVDPSIVTAAAAPFRYVYGASVPGNGPAKSCLSAFLWTYDRDGNSFANANFSPPPPSAATVNLCQQINVLQFGASGSPDALGSANFNQIIQPFASQGSARLDLKQDASGAAFQSRPSNEGIRINGLPVIGFEASNYINANAQPGMLSNYSGLYVHRKHRSCAGTTSPCS